ncbi:DsbA family protein [Patescibacteria group bacterium]|nr:DsbA family protein [Patescibacteria group bacterium]
MEQHHSNKGPIDNLKPKAAFKAGLLSGLGVMFAIGFFVLLGMMLNGKDFSLGKNTNSNNNNQIANANTNDNAAAAAITIQPVDKDKDWIRGNKNAKVSIIEFSDIDCPFCQRFHDTMNEIMKEYGNDVNWVYRHFPLTSLHPEAAKKAEASECVGEQGGNDKFWEFLDKVFAAGTKVADLGVVVSNMGLNANDFQSCLDSGKYAAKVQDQSRQAQAAGGRGTPYSIIISGDQKVPIPGALPIDSVKASLDSILK